MERRPRHQDMAETTIQSREVFRGRLLRLRVDEVRLPTGRVATREVVEHPGAVAIVPVAEDGRLVMVYQYRYPIREVTLEIPAGKLDPGERPEDCAARELVEETGLVASWLERLLTIITTPGFSDETIHVFVGKDLCVASGEEHHPDDDENLRAVELDRGEVLRAIFDGTIRDAKTIAGVLAYFSLHERS